ncbi:MAG: hypothetical protein Q9N32_05390 [Gammaproteobacteria bacterium]|nr:hypothetical protein [Gammaproteobacteria bacterium]
MVRSDTQRNLLDTVANTQPLLKQLAIQYQQLKTTQKQLDELIQQSQDQSARSELLAYQVSELESLNLGHDHIKQLLQEHQQRTNISQLLNAAHSAQQQLFEQEQGSAYALVGQALNDLATHQDIEPQFANLIEALNSAIIQLDEVSHELRHYLDHVDNDPQRLQDIEAELAILHDQARKHHIEIEQLPEHFQQLQQELSSLANIELHAEQLEQQLDQQQVACRELCKNQ